MEQLKEYFKDKKVNLILDAGTGTGDFIAVLKEIFPKSEITGIDPNAESLYEAKEKYPEVTFIENGAENLDFEDNVFDAASISMALHHVPDVQKSLNELQRVVKPGGWIIVNELYSDNLNKAQETHKIYHHFRSKIDRLTGVSHNETFKKSEIIDIIKDSGIETVLVFDNIIPQETKVTDEILEEKLNKMKQLLEKVKNLTEYDLLKPEIKKFRSKLIKYGFQSPPRVVIVGKVTR